PPSRAAGTTVLLRSPTLRIPRACRHARGNADKLAPSATRTALASRNGGMRRFATIMPRFATLSINNIVLKRIFSFFHRAWSLPRHSHSSPARLFPVLLLAVCLSQGAYAQSDEAGI